jgi:hypothetical protein
MHYKINTKINLGDNIFILNYYGAPLQFTLWNPLQQSPLNSDG